MASPDFARLRELFDQAIQLPSFERRRFLDQACAGDDDLRRRLENLLATAEGDDVFLSEPTVAPECGSAGSLAPTSSGLSLIESAGARIGPYKLLQMIGEGGFGAVFLAEQETPVRRRVALKIIKLGMDTRQVIARFEAERQALAMMDHPNIARVLDAGATETGRPYFVMELVRGDPITAYCDTNKLPIRERLELFQQVCHAVQHAHTKGIIHRDIKPSNILITVTDGKPIPKVIDFGIAKATSARLTEKTLFTEHRQLIGTPAYMSPEQAEMSGVDIDTRSDIYSLGVLLYELLTGVPPFDPERLRSAAYGEIQRIIREEEPPTPSTRLSALATKDQIAAHRGTEPPRLNSMIKGDLDWIIMMALEKDRTRRYDTASGLAQDVQRHLAGEPVQAAPPSATYRTRKFVRKHRIGVAFAATLTAAVLIAATSSIYGVLSARAGQREAQRQTRIAEAVNAFLTEDLLAAVIPEGERRPGRGRNVKLRDVLDAAAANLDESSLPSGRFAEVPLVEASLRSTIGDAYLQLGEPERAAPHLHRSLQLHERERGHKDPYTLRSRAALIGLYRSLGNYAEAIATGELVVQQAQQSLGTEHQSVAMYRRALGVAYAAMGRWKDAEAELLAAKETLTRLKGPENIETLSALNSLAELYRKMGRLKEAEPLFARTAEITRRTLGNEHPLTLGYTSNLAALYYDAARYQKAKPLMLSVLDIRRRVLGPEHPQTLDAMLNLANVLHALDDPASAEQLERELLAILQRTLGPEHPDTLTSMMHLGQTLLSAGSLDEAEEIISTVLEAQRRLLGEEHDHTLLSIENLAQLYQAQGRYLEAEEYFDRAIEIGLKLHGPRHVRPLGSRTNLASLYTRIGRLEDAEMLYRETLELMRPTLGMQHPYTRICMRGLASVLQQRGDVQTARNLLAEVRDWEASAAETAKLGPRP